MTYRQGIGWLLIALGVLLMLALMLAPRPAQAQSGDPPPALTVTILDTRGQGVRNVRVLVLARSGDQVFAQAATDASGRARIDALPTGDVRVVVEGQWQGRALTQAGADAGGILLVGGDPPLRLDLRATPDGHVIPDPATMIAPDLAGPSVPIPTALMAGASIESREQPGLPEATTLAGAAGADLAGVPGAPEETARDPGAPEPASAESNRSAGATDGPTLVLVALCLLACAVLTMAIAHWARPA